MIDERPPQLDAYRKKRDPDRTPEPFGGRRPAERPGSSWSRSTRRGGCTTTCGSRWTGCSRAGRCPRGPRCDAEEKRLAVHVEDHPLEYADFEGVIPDGNYGAGSVIVWDRGWYRSVKPEDPRDQLARGKLEVELFGYKLRGRWTLVRMGGRRDRRTGSCSRRPTSPSRPRTSHRALPAVGAAPGSRSRRCATRAPCARGAARATRASWRRRAAR